MRVAERGGGKMPELLTDTEIDRIVMAARAAPSIHNTQPWHFSARPDGIIELHAEIDRALWVSDPQARALYISCGAALFNIRMAIRMTGHEPVVELLPHPEYPLTALAIIRVECSVPPTAAERLLHDAIGRRHTDRGPFTGQPVPASVRADMAAAAEAENGTLRWVAQRDVARVLSAAAAAGRELAADAEHERELRRWIATGSGVDGIPAGALPSRPAHRPSPVRDCDLAPAARGVRLRTAVYETLPQIAFLTTGSDEPEDWLRAGQALERLLLTATANGVAASLLYQPIELMDMCEGRRLPSLPKNLQMIMRFGYGSRLAATPRRPQEDLLAGSDAPQRARSAT
jgi:nitroreductase